MPAENKQRPKRLCPNCGKRMVQQFIGLYHCKCGTTKINGEYIERTPDMVFCLRREVTKKGKNSVKTKQVPTIRYKSNNDKENQND